MRMRESEEGGTGVPRAATELGVSPGSAAAFADDVQRAEATIVSFGSALRWENGLVDEACPLPPPSSVQQYPSLGAVT